MMETVLNVNGNRVCTSGRFTTVPLGVSGLSKHGRLEGQMDRCHTGEESFNRQFPECCCSRTLSQLRCVSATSARLGVSLLVATPALLWLLQYLPFVGEGHPFFFFFCQNANAPWLPGKDSSSSACAHLVLRHSAKRNKTKEWKKLQCKKSGWYTNGNA